MAADSSRRNRSHSDRSEASGAAIGSLGSRRKGGTGDRARGLAWDKLPPPTAPWVASLMEPLRVQEVCACGGQRGEGKGAGSLPGERVYTGTLIPRVFKGRESRGDVRGGSNRTLISFMLMR